jgi:hypothetical protein
MHTIDDVSAIGETVNAFFAGMHTGDTERLQAAFHPAANLFGYYMGDLCQQSLGDWMEEVEGSPKPSALYQGLRFTDYLTLAKIEDQWKIVNKAYHHD